MKILNLDESKINKIIKFVDTTPADKVIYLANFSKSASIDTRTANRALLLFASLSIVDLITVAYTGERFYEDEAAYGATTKLPKAAIEKATFEEVDIDSLKTTYAYRKRA